MAYMLTLFTPNLTQPIYWSYFDIRNKHYFVLAENTTLHINIRVLNSLA